MADRKRRSPGEGGAYPYDTNSGQKWRIKAVITQADGSKKEVNKRGFTSKTAALKWLKQAQVDGSRGEFTEPSKQPFGDYLATWLDGLRLAPSTVASYKKNIRLHVTPHLGSVPLAQITPARLDAVYRALEKDGRADYRSGEGLSPRSVRYIHAVISGALRDAMNAGLITRNPCARANPPTARQARAKEVHPWTAAQLAAFLAWSKKNSDLHTAWTVLAMTGCRRGELLALRWRDVDFAQAAITIRRSANVIRVKGEPGAIIEGPPKSGKARVIDVDPGTVAELKSWKKERGTLNLPLARDDALVFGDVEGAHLHPERLFRTWGRNVARAVRDGVDIPPIRLHDCRHTHATLLLQDGEPLKTVSERLGHASATITLGVYSHVMPGDQKRAATRFARLVGGA